MAKKTWDEILEQRERNKQRLYLADLVKEVQKFRDIPDEEAFEIIPKLIPELRSVRQRYLLQVIFFDGMTIYDLAKEENSHAADIRDVITRGCKNLVLLYDKEKNIQEVTDIPLNSRAAQQKKAMSNRNATKLKKMAKVAFKVGSKNRNANIVDLQKECPEFDLMCFPDAYRYCNPSMMAIVKPIISRMRVTCLKSTESDLMKTNIEIKGRKCTDEEKNKVITYMREKGFIFYVPTFNCLLKELMLTGEIS